jgi:hypothetical protein
MLVGRKITAASRFCHSPDVACRTIANEVLVVPIRKNPREKLGIYSLNQTASFLWEKLDGRRTVGEMARQLCARYEVDPKRARADVEMFLRDMLAAGTVTRRSEG